MEVSGVRVSRPEMHTHPNEIANRPSNTLCLFVCIPFHSPPERLYSANAAGPMDSHPQVATAGFSPLQKRLLLADLASDTDDISEAIACVQTLGPNLYVATSKGRIAHYHQFEDASGYMMINLVSSGRSEDTPGTGGPIRKMLLLPTINMLMALGANGSLALYALPELTPYHSKWHMENVVDVLLLALSEKTPSDGHRSGTHPKHNDKLLAFTATHIKIVQISREQLDVIKEIPYPNSIRGISISSSMTSNYSNLAIVANRTNYDIIDIRQIRKIPLFQYSPVPLARTPPFMIAYRAFDSGKEEYLLTVKSDESMSMAMIINALGDVTRGTLTWIDLGYPTGGVIVRGEYVYGIFTNRLKGTSKLVVSSLQSLDVVSEENIGDLFGDSATAIAGEEDSATAEFDDAQQSKEAASMEETVSKDTVEDIQPGSKDTTDDVPSKDTIENTPNPPVIHIEKAQCMMAADTQVSDLLSKYDFVALSSVGEPPLFMKKHNDAITFYDQKRIWIMTEPDNLTQLQGQIDLFLKDRNFEFILDVKTYLKGISVSSDIYAFGLHVLFLSYLYLHDYDNAIQIALTLSEATQHLVISIGFVSFLCGHEHPDGVISFKGLQAFYFAVKGKFQSDQLYTDYCRSVYKHLSYQIAACVRVQVYRSFISSADVIAFVDEDDRHVWKDFDRYPENRQVFDELQQRGHYLALIFIAEVAMEDTTASPETRAFLDNTILRTSLDVITKKSSDSSLDLLMQNKKYDFNLTQKVLHLLSGLKDHKQYQNSLLELIEVSPAEGIGFIKKHNDPDKQSIHKHIMDVLAQKKSDDYDFGAIRLEFLENSFVDDPKNAFLASELLHELANKLNADYQLDVVKNNLEIIHATFSLECSLQFTIWPKVGWIDYLIIQASKSEISEFIKCYVKVFELLLITQQTQSKGDDLDLSSFAYLSILSSDDTKESVSQKLDKLLQFNDFASAEYYAIHGTFPVPLRPMYAESWELKQSFLQTNIQPNLNQILEYYLANLPDKHSSLEHCRHFVLAYGKEYFSPTEILHMMPDYTPIAFLASYIEDFIIGLNIDHENSHMRKSLAKARLKQLQQLQTLLVVEEGSS